MKYISLLFIVFFFNLKLTAQSLEWSKGLGSGSNDIVYSMTTDADGNQYITGYFQDSVDFDPGVGVTTLKSNGGFDIFVCKYNSEGNLVWAKQIGGSSNDVGEGITIDVYGNTYLTGYFQDSVDFDPGSATYNLVSSGSYDIFTLKLNTSGDFVWAKSQGGSGIDIAYSIATDSGCNVYSTGYFRSTADFNPGSGTFNLTANGIRDIFISKLDSSGNFIWVKQIGGVGYDDGRAIKIDAYNDIVLTGSFQDTVDFDPGNSTNPLISNGLFDIFVCKLDSSGKLLWAKGMGSTNTEIGSSLVTDQTGNVYTTGYFYGTVDFNPDTAIYNLKTNGSRDVFVLKLDRSGSFTWAKQFGGKGDDRGFAITMDSSGNLFTTGMFEYTVDFNPDSAVVNLTSNGDADAFISKLTENGDFVWAIQMGGSDDDAGYGVSTDKSKNIYSAGVFEGTADFDPSNNSHNHTSNGDADLFIHKISECPSAISIDSISACDSITWIDNKVYKASTTSPVYVLAGKAVSGCDSLVFLHLTILNIATSIDSVTTCDSFTWIDNVTYTSSTSSPVYTYKGGGVNGCDSLVSLHLTIHNTATSIDSVTTCDSFTWIDNVTYTSSTSSPVYTYKGGGVNGCDSLVFLHLTIHNTATSIDSVTTCDSFTWIDNVTYTSSTSSPVYTYKGGGVNGCDSLVFLHLTIHNTATSIDSVTTCDSFTWIDNVTYTSSTNTATYTILGGAVNGCDSVIQLNLTINSVSDVSLSTTISSITANNSLASYNWLDCENGFARIQGSTNQVFVPEKNGEYAVELTENGCVDTSECVEFEKLSNLEDINIADFRVYPNPTLGTFTIDLGLKYSVIKLSLYNANGKLIRTKEFGQQQIIHSLIEEAPGLYFIKIETEDKNVLLRLVKK